MQNAYIKIEKLITTNLPLSIFQPYFLFCTPEDHEAPAANLFQGEDSHILVLRKEIHIMFFPDVCILLEVDFRGFVAKLEARSACLIDVYGNLE